MHVGVLVLMLLPLVEVALQVLEELLAAAAVETGVGVLVPVADHQEAEEHTAQMGRVGHAVAGRGDGREELDGYIAHDEPFCLDGEGEGDDEQPLVGESHAEGQDHGIDGTGSTDGRPAVKHIGILRTVLQDGG